jgi:hypothetical protein
MMTTDHPLGSLPGELDPYVRDLQYAFEPLSVAAADPRTPESYLLTAAILDADGLLALLRRTPMSAALAARLVRHVSWNPPDREVRNAAVEYAARMPGVRTVDLELLTKVLHPGCFGGAAALRAVLSHEQCTDLVAATAMCRVSGGHPNRATLTVATQVGSLIPAAIAIVAVEKLADLTDYRNWQETVAHVAVQLRSEFHDSPMALAAAVSLGNGWPSSRDELITTAFAVASVPESDAARSRVHRLAA